MAQGALAQKYLPSKPNATIKQHLQQIKDVHNIEIAYSNLLIPDKNIEYLPSQFETVGDALYYLLKDCNINIIEKEKKILLIPAPSVAGKEYKYTFNGYVKDDKTQEVIIGAWLQILHRNLATESNSYGFYSLTLPEGYFKMVVHAIGYKSDTISFYCNASQRREIKLQNMTTLPEVKISSDKKREIQIGSEKLLMAEELKRPINPLGESDVYRRLQQEPGVTVGLVGSTSLRVRGGDPGQNLNLLDGVPVYYVDHLYGASSIFNTDAVKSVGFYKGAFPAKYGGRISSIVDVSTKDGNMTRHSGQASLSVLKGTLSLEGPLVKNKSSYFISARRTWVDAVMPFFIDSINLHFYDVNAKINYIINDKNRVYLSLYNGGDVVKEQTSKHQSRASWGNSIASLRWTSILNPRLFLNTTLSLSLFKYQLKDRREIFGLSGLENGNSYVGTSTIRDITARTSLEYSVGPKHTLSGGIHYSNEKFIPSRITSPTIGFPAEYQEFQVNETGIFMEDKLKLGAQILLSGGINFTNWSSKDFSYYGWQPRLTLSFIPAINQKFYASASYMTQFLHLISNNTYGLPTDFWIPSTASIKPEVGWQSSLGFAGYKSGYHYSIEGYYKDVDGVALYTTGKDIFDNSLRWQDRVIQGKGWSYGLETSLNKQWHQLYFYTTYTLSWSWRQYQELNEGAAFPYRYDRRHNFKIGVSYQPSNFFNATADWTYMSGEAFTLPDQIYPDFDRNLYINPQNSVSSDDYTYFFNRWNNYRLPAIHHLDLSLNFSGSINKNLSHSLSLGVSNAYGRPNVWFARLEQDYEKNRLKLVGYSYTRFLPFITYKFNF